VDLIYSVIRPALFDKKKKYPVITVVYGGPCVRLVKNEWKDYQFHKVAQYMADRGYVIFSVDNRGSSERGKAFEDPIYGKMGSVEVEDQKAGIEMLKAKYSWIDPERIGIMGHSYGGYMTLMAMMKEPDIFKAGYAGAPWVDPKEYNACYTERFLGDPKANKKGYKESCVLTHARKLKGPVSIAAGKLDDNVLWEKHASRLLDELNKWGHPFDMTLLPDEKHGFKDRNNNIQLYTSVVQFFDKHLR
jgi:dipeptidyl-peptidase-4